jgi:hypothetical protein
MSDINQTLGRPFGVISGDQDHNWALIKDTTLEAIRDHIDEYNAELDAAVEKAREMKKEAEEEDERLKKETLQLIYKLRRDYGLDAPPG